MVQDVEDLIQLLRDEKVKSAAPRKALSRSAGQAGVAARTITFSKKFRAPSDPPSARCPGCDDDVRILACTC